MTKSESRHHSRIYTLGMQSSGSSLFSLYLAQIPDSLAVIDVWIRQPVPRLAVNMPVSLKTCICDVRCFQQDVRTFRPTLKILYLRHPVDIYRSLENKWYYNDGGPFEEKMKTYEKLFMRRRELFDLTVAYEDFTRDPDAIADTLRELGIKVPQGAGRFSRSIEEIEDYACKHSRWCRENFGIRWTHANIHLDKLAHLRPISYGSPDRAAVEKVRRLCPQILDHYERELIR